MISSSSTSSFTLCSFKSQERAVYRIEKSKTPGFQWQVKTPLGKVIAFGPLAEKEDREKMEVIRATMVWSDESIETEEFWTRWILYNKRTFKASVEDVCKRFDISIEYPKPKKSWTLPKNFKAICEKADYKLAQEIIQAF